jgi:hypothetical protein
MRLAWDLGEANHWWAKVEVLESYGSNWISNVCGIIYIAR